jgi:hypothetical protein
MVSGDITPPTLRTLCLAPGWSSTPSACSLYQLSREAGLAHRTNLQCSSQEQVRTYSTLAMPEQMLLVHQRLAPALDA